MLKMLSQLLPGNKFKFTPNSDEFAFLRKEGCFYYYTKVGELYDRRTIDDCPVIVESAYELALLSDLKPGDKFDFCLSDGKRKEFTGLIGNEYHFREKDGFRSIRRGNFAVVKWNS